METPISVLPILSNRGTVRPGIDLWTLSFECWEHSYCVRFALIADQDVTSSDMDRVFAEICRTIAVEWRLVLSDHDSIEPFSASLETESELGRIEGVVRWEHHAKSAARGVQIDVDGAQLKTVLLVSEP